MNSAGSRPIAVDLFSGAGGLSLGFEQAGFDVAAAVEFDPVHAAIHKVNFPDCATFCRDIRFVSAKDIREGSSIGKSAIDVVFGGPPCQGFSMIGHRNLGDRRNELVFHFLRLVTELRPRVFVMENVPGMAIHPHTEVLDELVRQFEAAGYSMNLPYKILRATDYGVPQNRRRLFLLGARRGAAIPGYPPATTAVLSDPSSFMRLERCPNVGDAISDLPEIEQYDSLLETDELPRVARGGSVYAQRLRGELRDPQDYSYPRKSDRNVITGCLRARHTPESRARFRETEGGSTEPISRFFKLSLLGVCNTLRAGTASDRGAFSAPRPIHPTQPRCISVREAARLHSYPDWFRFHRTIWHGFRQIGNSVPPMLGRAVGASVMRALGVKPQKPRRVVCPGPSVLAGFTMKEAAEYFGVDPGVIPARKRLAVAS